MYGDGAGNNHEHEWQVRANENRDAEWLVRGFQYEPNPILCMNLGANEAGSELVLGFVAPTYVRLPVRFRDAIFHESLDQGAYGPDYQSEHSGPWRQISIQSGGASYCVQCNSVTVLPSLIRAGARAFPHPAAKTVASGYAFDLAPHLQLLDGSSLRLHDMTVSHGQTLFRAIGRNQKMYCLVIIATNLIETMVQVEDVCFEVGNEDDVAYLAHFLPGEHAHRDASQYGPHRLLTTSNILAINSASGRFRIWAGKAVLLEMQEEYTTV